MFSLSTKLPLIIRPFSIPLRLFSCGSGKNDDMIIIPKSEKETYEKRLSSHHEELCSLRSIICRYSDTIKKNINIDINGEGMEESNEIDKIIETQRQYRLEKYNASLKHSEALLQGLEKYIIYAGNEIDVRLNENPNSDVSKLLRLLHKARIELDKLKKLHIKLKDIDTTSNEFLDKRVYPYF